MGGKKLGIGLVTDFGAASDAAVSRMTRQVGDTGGARVREWGSTQRQGKTRHG